MVFAIVFVLLSCDTDPNELGGSFLGINIDSTIIEEEFVATAFSTSLNPVQTNNFPAAQLGYYNDPIYGETTYDFVTQVALNNAGVNFGENRKLDSVILTIPYFSAVTGSSGEAIEYELDSLYGGGSIDFQIFRSNYFLNSFNPNNVEEGAVFYSDFGPIIDANKGDALQFVDVDSLGVVSRTYSEIENFRPSNEQIILKVRDSAGNPTQTTRESPRFRQHLERSFWKNLIIDNGDASYLQSDSEFRNFFRGLYFKITGVNDAGIYSYLNLNGANITLFYRSDIRDVNDLDQDGDTTDFLQTNLASSYQINIAGNRIVMLDNDVPSTLETEIANSFDPAAGASRIFLKGGEGTMTFIDLFGPDNDGDGEADALTELKSKNVIINEANIELFVDQERLNAASVDPGSEPERIFIYDFKESRLLADFIVSNASGVNSNTNHLGRLVRDENGRGVSYRIRLTRHIENIINDRVDNNRLGLFVSQNVELLGSSEVENQTTPIEIERIPLGSAISHEGTVLHGNLSSDPDKRLKLRIFYTELD